MRIVVSFLSLFLPLYLLAQNGQARQPNVMVVPFVEPGEGENDRIKDAVLNDEAVPLALSKIKEEFNLRNFKTIDFMTAEAAEIPYEVLNKVMSRIINEVKGVNRVFYDLTSKPPGTIEFE